MNRPKYKYSPVGKGWAVYEMTYKGVFSSGEKIGWYWEKEEARKEVYRLNGWEYKEKNNVTLKNK